MKGKRLWMVTVLVGILFAASPALAQRIQPTDVTDGRCVVPVPLWYGPGHTGGEFANSKFCASRDGAIYDLASSLDVAGTLFATEMVVDGRFTAGDPREGIGMTLTESALLVQGQLGVRAKGTLFFADVVVGSSGQVMTSGSGETASNGVAVILFDLAFIRIVNRSANYLVVVGAAGPEAVYWDDASSTPTSFVVRSISGKRARFTYIVVAAAATPAQTPLLREDRPTLEIAPLSR
jgi:hypothetical protein